MIEYIDKAFEYTKVYSFEKFSNDNKTNNKDKKEYI